MGLKKFLASLFGANSLKEEIKEDSKTETKKEDENLLKAIEFYKKAASQGHAEAKYKLGMYYKDGHGVKQSYYEAFKLFESAAYYEHREAQYELAMLYDKGYEDGQKTGHRRTNDIKRYLRSSAEKGYLKAKYELGKFYYFEYDEKRFPKDYELAFDCFWQVADLIEYKYPEYINTVYDSHTQFYLGLFFQNGYGIPQNYSKALEHYKNSGIKGYDKAQYEVAIFYKNGYGTDKNYNEAIKWFELAAKQGHREAQYELAVCYKNGYGTDKNYNEAIKWFELAAKQGQKEAQYELAVYYENKK